MAYEKVISPSNITTPYATPTADKPKCVVFNFERFAENKVDTPPNYVTVSDLAEEIESTAAGRASLEDARRWIADAFHAEDGITIRTLRLHRGLSQSQLAQTLGTSQSHIARIERGTENLTIDTCRRLSQALGIDMNTLDDALKRQETFDQEKIKR